MLYTNSAGRLRKQNGVNRIGNLNCQIEPLDRRISRTCLVMRRHAQ